MEVNTKKRKLVSEVGLLALPKRPKFCPPQPKEAPRAQKKETKTNPKINKETIAAKGNGSSMSSSFQEFVIAPYLGGEPFQMADGSAGRQQKTRHAAQWVNRDAILSKPLPVISFHFSERFAVTEFVPSNFICKEYPSANQIISYQLAYSRSHQSRPTILRISGRYSYGVHPHNYRDHQLLYHLAG
jgi:hypothetical protein